MFKKTLTKGKSDGKIKSTKTVIVTDFAESVKGNMSEKT